MVRLYVNFFKPVVKLQAKRHVGSKIKKIYDKPKTPCQRLLECESLSPADKQKLEATFKRLRLSQVKAELDKRLAALRPTKLSPGLFVSQRMAFPDTRSDS